MAVNKFKKMRQSIASCLEEPESQTDTGMAPVSKSSRSLEDIWVSLVKYLVLQHKSQGASAISFGDALTNEQVELLRSVSQDETNSDLQKSTGETIFSFTEAASAGEALQLDCSVTPPAPRSESGTNENRWHAVQGAEEEFACELGLGSAAGFQ